MVILSKIYTKTGDKGTTALGDNSRVSKTDPLIEAYSTVDEANASIGMIMAFGTFGDNGKDILNRLQNELFDVGADLCTPYTPNDGRLRITEYMVSRLEKDIDLYNSTLEPLRSFVMPGGNQTSALFHVARTIVRRAERRVWNVTGREVNPLVAQYLNRLSDLFFVMARFYNENEVLWTPGGEVSFEEMHPPKRFRDIGNAE
jgi:cob(I)alamin adenosyltransferase